MGWKACWKYLEVLVASIRAGRHSESWRGKLFSIVGTVVLLRTVFVQKYFPSE